MFVLNQVSLGPNDRQMQNRKQQEGKREGVVEEKERNLPSKRGLIVNGKHQPLSGLTNQSVQKSAQKEWL